jgi:uncharacterized membrane protein
MVMNKSAFIQKLDQAAITAAIADAEKNTSGEIRVVLSHRPAPEPLAAAQAAFVRLRMERTTDRNGVLIFIAPESQTFAIVGDTGVNRQCGQAFWNEMSAAMTAAFAAGDFTTGLTAAIGKAGKLLQVHFPRQSDDQDELPNTVVEQ